MLNNIVIYTNTSNTPNDRKTLELFEFLKTIAPCPIQLNPKTKSVERSLVLIAGYNKEFFNLHHTNQILFLCRKPSLTKNEVLLLPIINTIIANSISEAISISWQLQCDRFNNKVTYLLPWCKPQKLSDSAIYCQSLDDRFKPAFAGYELQTTNPNSYIRVHLSELDKSWPYNIIEGMVSGAIPIVTDRHPFSDFIINGYNGFLIRSPGEIVQALQKIEKNKEWLSFNARSTVNAQLEPTRYLNSLLNIELTPNLNQFNSTPHESSKRSWLIREQIFNDGKVRYFPENHDKNLTIISLNSVQEIIGYFLNQEFSDVYIFGCNLDDHPEIQEMVELHRSIIKMGPRAKKIHFCRDEPIPPSWNKIFSNLSIISIVEGLKQISD